MRGIIFTEFMDMVEEKFSYELLDDIITHSDLPSGGVYTSVGSYPHEEMVTLVTGLSERSEIPVPVLLETFGKHMFGVFQKNYQHFFKHTDNTFDFLESIEDYIHVEVRKLYPDAELPTFQTKRLNDSTLEMIYLSERSMGDLAYGLILSTIEHYQQNITIRKEIMDESGKSVKFTLIEND